VVLVYDFFARPFEPDPITGSILYRWFTVFGITTLGLVVSILVLRHTPGNVTGLCLLLWCVLNLGQAVPPNSPFYISNGIINTGWTGLWLLALYFPNGRAAPLRALDSHIECISCAVHFNLEPLSAHGQQLQYE
jgi:hypothetical protein